MTAGNIRHGRDRLGREVLGVRSREADPVDAGAGDGVQYLGEALLAVEVATVAVDVLTKQRDLTYAVRHQAPHLCLDLRDRAATPHVRARTERCSTCRSCRIRW